MIYKNSGNSSPLRPEVVKIYTALLFQSLTANGLNCCSSSIALRTIAINHFSWTDILVLLGYHMDPDACFCRLRLV